MEVPFVDFKKQYDPIRGEIDDAIKSVVDDYYFVYGHALRKFEAEFANFIGTKFCVGVGSGTDALVLSLMSIRDSLGDKTEVIVPDLTFSATLNAVIMAGLDPVVIDSNKSTFCIFK